jgi:hypothetical protein
MESNTILATEQWAEQQWGSSQLGDQRRTRRAVLLGAAMAASPAGSLPQQTGSWGALKGAYRLLHQSDVTHEALSHEHWNQTRQQAALPDRVVLFIQDTSDIDLTAHRASEGFGILGDGSGRGIMVHSCLAVVPPEDATTPPVVLGLAWQRLWLRQKLLTRGETRTERLKRWRESEVWAETLRAIGPPAGQWVSVGDRASDVFNYIDQACRSGWHVLVRVKQSRRIEIPNGQTAHLIEHMRTLPPVATTTHTLRTRNGHAGEQIALQLSVTHLRIEPPQLGRSPDAVALKLWCIRCWGQRSDGSTIEWILMTDIAINDTPMLLRVVAWYADRWLIEEYHKCLKTGCRIEQRQIRSVDGFMALVGFSAIVAVRLLVMRTLARQQPEQPAIEVVDRRLVQLLLLRLAISRDLEALSLREFWHGVARLGGFLARTSDGEPGWQTLWLGWQQLQQMFWATQQALDPP